MQHFTKEIGTAGATLTGYLHNAEAEMPQMMTRPAVIICPGGGYGFVSARESEVVAIAFMNMGFHAFVLDYTTQGHNRIEETGKIPETPLGMQPLIEIASSVKLLREHAQEWRIHSDKIAVCGFSAGSHLAGSLGVLYQNKDLCAAVGASADMLRPDAMILAYPVITDLEYSHANSFRHLLGAGVTPEQSKLYSIEKQVSSDTPPTFLWHTVDDQIVPVENSLLMATALQKHKVPFEMHIYDSGAHGLSLCNGKVNTPSPHLATWVPLCEEWLKRQMHLEF